VGEGGGFKAVQWEYGEMGEIGRTGTACSRLKTGEAFTDHCPPSVNMEQGQEGRWETTSEKWGKGLELKIIEFYTGEVGLLTPLVAGEVSSN